MKTRRQKPLLTDINTNSSAKRVDPECAFLHTLSDNLSDAVIITDKQLRIEYWNKPASQLFGFTETEAAGKHIADLLFPHYDNIFFEKLLRHNYLQKEKEVLIALFLFPGPLRKR